MTLAETALVTVYNEETKKIEEIPASEAKGKRVVLPVEPKDYQEHNPYFVKAGYLRAMTIKDGCYRVRVPKKETELRKFWNYEGSRASFDLSLEWDPVWLEEIRERKSSLPLPKYGDLDFDKYLTEEEQAAYWCGFSSACIYLNMKGGYLTFPLPYHSKDRGGEIWGAEIGNHAGESDIVEFTINHEGEQMYIQGVLNLKKFIEKIGLIQPLKMEELLQLYYQKSYKVSSIVNEKGKSVGKLTGKPRGPRKPKVASPRLGKKIAKRKT